ncbi:MAG: hypothetical protein QOJ68_2484, partial [Blastococcus sp.]|nr:hypothetical protein [Blastococcus sp.]
MICAAVLMVGGLAPALLISARGAPIDRLVGLELVSSIGVVIMLLIAQITDQSYYLAAP